MNIPSLTGAQQDALVNAADRAKKKSLQTKGVELAIIKFEDGKMHFTESDRWVKVQ